MRTLTIITSYNRKKSLLKLLSILEKQSTDIVIYDDNSDFNLNIPNYIKFNYKHGKEYLWYKFMKIFHILPKTYDNYIILPDDVTVGPTFIEESVELWRGLNDKSKICLSLLTDDRTKKPNWTNTYPLIVGNYIKTQWQDLCFICGQEFLTTPIEPITLERWQILGKSLNMELGSGLGGQISRYWHKKGRSMYHVKNNLVIHGKEKSLMNPIERKATPLESVI